MAKYRIIALDGGGVRGVLTAVMLKRIDGKFPGWRKDVNLIAGTSTGGLLALGLGRGLGPDDLIDFYTKAAPGIFTTSLLDKIKDVGSLIGAPYKSAPLEATLKNMLGEKTLLGELKPLIVIPSFNLDSDYEFDDGVQQQKIETWLPKVFHNDASLGADDSDGAELAYKVGMRTSAAPTYFPTYGTFIDGGVFANNPTMVALAQALATKKNTPALSDIVLLNLGTGVHESVISGQNHDWGEGQWIANIVDLVLDGSMDVAKFECARLIGNRYYRISPYLKDKVPLDDPAQVQNLIAIAQQLDMTRVFDWVQAHWL